MKGKSKTLFFVTFIAGIFLLTEVLFGHFFPKVTFVKGGLTIANKIVGYLAFSLFLIGLLLSFKVNRFVTTPAIVVLLLFFCINSCFEIYPIDTTTEPRDVAVVRKDEDGSKLIAREYTNAKTNEVIRDTIWVKDYFVFRRMLNKEIKHPATNR